MAGLTRKTIAKVKGGGGKIIGQQIQRNPTTGALEPITGTDCLGATAATWHEFGSIETTDLPRDDNGGHTLTVSLVEWDTDRRNLLLKIAPYVATADAKKEELDLEDGTVLESTDASGEDTTLPYWGIIYRGAPLSEGTECAFFCVAQAKRSGGPNTTKAGAYTKPKISFTSIDPVTSYTCLKPVAEGADSWVDGCTAPDLTGATAMGVWVEATA